MYLPTSSALPGRFRFDRAMFQKEIFDTLSDPYYKDVVIMAASQMVKTQSLLNYIAYIIHLDPGPILCVQQTGTMAERFSKDRIDTMLETVPVLRGKVRDKRERDSNNTTRYKAFPGGNLTIASAGSASELAMSAIRYLFLDEADAYTPTKEGDPVDLATARQTTFEHNRKRVIVTSPRDEDTSRAYKEYKRSDQRVFLVPCHECGHHQELTWSNVVWGDNPKNAHYECSECNAHWSDSQKNLNVQKGHWHKNNPESDVAGFHISAIYSSFVSLSKLAQEFLERKRAGEHEFKTFINTRLAQVWRNKSQTVGNIDFLERLSDYDDQSLPTGIGLITAGVDVQKDRLEIQVRGWGAGDENWLVDYEVLHGLTSQPHVWKQLEDYFTKVYTRTDGVRLKIATFCVDSSHFTDDAYAFTEKHRRRQVFAIKGQAGEGRLIFPNRATRGKNNHLLYRVGVDTAKEKIYSWLNLDEPGPGYCHFYTHILDDNPDYFDQLTSERYILKYNKNGKKTKQWFLPPNTRNEALDTFVYALAARQSLKLDIAKRVEGLAKRAASQNDSDNQPAQTEQPQKTLPQMEAHLAQPTQTDQKPSRINRTPKPRRRPGGGYLGGLKNL